MAGPLESLLFGFRTLKIAGVELPTTSVINFPAGSAVYNTSTNEIDINFATAGAILADTVDEYTLGAGVAVAGVQHAAGDLSAGIVVATSGIATDEITERTAAGVKISGTNVRVNFNVGQYASWNEDDVEIGRVSKDATYPLKISSAGNVWLGAGAYMNLTAPTQLNCIVGNFNGDATTGWNFQKSGVSRLQIDATGIGFFAAAPVAKPTVTGSRGGNAALASLLTALANLGLITDSSS